MPMIKLSDDSKLTSEVREAIDKKLFEMEKLQDHISSLELSGDPAVAELKDLVGIRGGRSVRINADTAAWGVSYHT